MNIYSKLLLDVIKRPPAYSAIKNLFNYQISMMQKKTTLEHHPVSLVFYTNKKCNFDCSFCYNKDVLNKPDAKDHDLTPDQIEKIYKTPFGQAALRAAFLGGEPFLNKDIFELFEISYQYRKIANVVTNASKLDDAKLEKLGQSPVNVVGISLYDNNLQDVLKAVDGLNFYKKEYWVQTIVDPNQLQKLEDKFQALAKHKTRNLILSNYNPNFTHQYDSVLKTDHAQYFSFQKKLKKLAKQSNMSVQWANPYPASIENKIKKCRMPFSYAHIDNKGGLAPCCFRYPRQEIYGNIFELKSWNTPDTIKIRNNLLNQAEQPLGECNGCENLYRDLYGI